MKTGNSWVIIDLVTKKALYGKGGATLRFSTYEIAYEVAEQFFNVCTEFVVTEIPELKKL